MADETQTPEEGLFIPRSTFEGPEFAEIVNILEGEKGGALPNLANMMVSTLSRDPRIADRGEDYMTYKGLRMGTAPVLQDLGFDPGETLSDAQIIELFGRDTEGRPISAGTEFWTDYFEGAAREAIPQAAGAGAFVAGMQGTNYALMSVPPVSPPTAALRILGPIVGGLGASATAMFLGEKATDALMGDERLFVPGTAAAYEMGKATSGGLAFLPMPFLIGSKVNLGAREALDNLAANAKAPLSTKLVRGVESAMERTGQAARANPLTTLAIETGAVTGGTIAAGGAEIAAPGNPYVRFGAEMTGNVGGGLVGDLAVKRVPQAIGVTTDFIISLYNRVMKDSAENVEGRLSPSQQLEGGRYILQQLQANKEDPEEIINLLLSPEFGEMLVDKDGNPINLDVATLTSSPTLLRLVMDQGDRGANISGLNKTEQALEALRRGVLFLYGNADRQALGELSEVQTALWDAELTDRLDVATRRLQDAMEKVGQEGGESVDNLAQAEKLIEVLGQQSDQMRAQEKKLWNSIPRDVEIGGDNAKFIDSATGEQTDTPNFVRYWQENVTNLIDEAQSPILRVPEMRDLNNFVDRKSGELGLTGTPVARQLPEEKRLDAALLKIEGTPTGDRFETTLQKLQDEGLSDQDIVRRLRQEANNQRGRFSSPRTRQLADAYDRQAELLVARAQQPAMDGTPAPSGGLSAQEIFDMRSSALALGKKLSAAGDSDKARIAYGFAESLMDDLESMPAGVNQAYDNARAYSRAYNNVFTRMYGGEVLGTRANGAPAIPPGVLATRMFNGDAGYLRAAQLDNIGQAQFAESLTTLLSPDDLPVGRELFESATQLNVINPQTRMIDRAQFTKWFEANAEAIDTVPGLRDNLTAAYNASSTIRGPVESLLRSARAAALDPNGTLNTNALQRWMRNPNNARMLDALPALKADLENVTTARTLLDDSVRATNEAELQRREGLLSLYELLPNKTLNPATQVSRAISLTNPRPFVDLNSLWSYIDDMGEEGFTVAVGPNKGKTFNKQELTNGMRSAVLEAVFNKNGENGPIFDVAGAYRILFEPHPNSPNDLTLADWMKSKGVMGEAELARTKSLLERMAKIQLFQARGKPGDTEGYAEAVGPLVQLVTRISGSELGAAGQQMMSGSTQSLIARQAGSQFAQNVVNTYLSELPASLRMNVIETLVNDPKLLAVALKRASKESEEQQQRIGMTLIQGFIDNGLLSSARRTAGPTSRLIEETVGEEEYEPPAPAPAPPVSQALPPPNQQGSLNPPPSSLPTLRGGPAPSPVQQVAAAAPTPTPQAPSGPVDRARFAALFPEDRELLGIGSLMG